MTIAKILADHHGEIIHCTADTPVESAIAMLARKKIGALPVLDGDSVVGIFSERDAIYNLTDFGADALKKSVGEIMTRDVVSVTPGKSAIGALTLMTRRRIRHLPVVDDGRLVGFVSIGDLVKYRIEKIEEEAAALRDYIQTA
jgi:CBS domain-containing protein